MELDLEKQTNKYKYLKPLKEYGVDDYNTTIIKSGTGTGKTTQAFIYFASLKKPRLPKN